MRVVAALLLLAAGPLLEAQMAPGSVEKVTDNVRLYKPVNLDPYRVSVSCGFVRSVLNNVKVDWDEAPQAIVIRANMPADLDAAEALLRRFDVSRPREVTPAPAECTVYLIRASKSALPAGSPGSPVPADLQPAVDEMKNSFGYRAFSLWEVLKLQPGNSEVQGLLAMDTRSLPAKPYVYTLASERVVTNQDRTVSIGSFRFGVTMPIATPNTSDSVESHIKTSVTIRENQKLVLGKIRLLPSEDADLFLVLTTKLPVK